jgi:hypothetical protein
MQPYWMGQTEAYCRDVMFERARLGRIQGEKRRSQEIRILKHSMKVAGNMVSLIWVRL